MSSIAYRAGYKYQLARTYTHQTELRGHNVRSPFILLDPRGLLTIQKAYAWDGPSGPSIDTSTFMRASLVHDALYQLIREGHLHKREREYADRLMRDICLADGMWRIRAWWVYRAVRRFARKAALPSRRRPTKEAP